MYGYTLLAECLSVTLDEYYVLLGCFRLVVIGDVSWLVLTDSLSF